MTCYNNPSVGSGSIENQITRQFDGFGQVTKTFQSHSGAVNPASTPSVGRSYSDGSGNVLRPTATLYPNGREVTLDYGSSGSITDRMNQVSSLIDDNSTVLAAYEYLGLSTFVQQTSPQPNLRYTLISPTLSIDPSTGDIYSGLDRFGRVKDVRWRDISAGTDLSRIQYGYDRASNRTWRENPSDPNREHDCLYAYDGLHRLSSAERGRLNSGRTAITNDQFNQCWSLDPTGNWKGFQQDDNADGTADLVQTRTANAVNEITDITNTVGAAWATPTYDPNGNSLVLPRPDLGPGASMTGIYDAWNRMTRLIDNDTSNVLLENQFDGRNFRIVAKEYASGILARTRDYYFTDAWQCVEEHVDTSNTPRRQYVWGMRYIDDLVLRDRDISPSGGLLTERLYYLADSNWNTTAVVSDSGSVQERYEYTPYGNLSIFEANFTPRAVSTYGVHYTYTSREWTPDAGLYYFRNRWYDAQLGRFSSRDPIGYGDGNSLYRAYFTMRGVDPSGFGFQLSIDVLPISDIESSLGEGTGGFTNMDPVRQRPFRISVVKKNVCCYCASVSQSPILGAEGRLVTPSDGIGTHFTHRGLIDIVRHEAKRASIYRLAHEKYLVPVTGAATSCGTICRSGKLAAFEAMKAWVRSLESSATTAFYQYVNEAQKDISEENNFLRLVDPPYPTGFSRQLFDGSALHMRVKKPSKSLVIPPCPKKNEGWGCW